MRLDKYLQVSRLVRRRVVARQLCDAGHVRVNDRRAKPATELAPGDLVDLRLGPRRLRVRVLSLPASPKDVERTPPFELVWERGMEAGGGIPPGESMEAGGG